jgi:hypothetical protein
MGGDPELAFPQPEDFKNDDVEGDGTAGTIEAEAATKDGDARGPEDDVIEASEADDGGEREGTGADEDGGAGLGGAKEGSVEPLGGGWAFPGSKVLLRRLKYNTQILKRSVARVGRQKRGATSFLITSIEKPV